MVGVLVPVAVLLAFAMYYYRRYREYLQRFVSIPLPDLGPLTSSSPMSSSHSTTPLTQGNAKETEKKRFVYGQMRQDEKDKYHYSAVDEENAFEIVRNPIRHRSLSSERKMSIGDDQDDGGLTEEKISISGIIKSGYLYKKSTRGSWLKRWFFISDGKLYYSKTPVEAGQSKGDTIEAVLVANFMISTFKIIDSLQFQVISPGKRGVGTGGGTYVLKTETEEEGGDWIRVIQTQIASALSMTLTPVSQKTQKDIANVEMFVPSKATLRKLADSNPYCADCDAPRPDWASLNLGIMMCIDCSGVHRSLGSHISKVRSLKLDKWSKNLLQLLVLLGNEHINEIWEESLRRVTEPLPDPLTAQRMVSDSSVIVDSRGHQHHLDKSHQQRDHALSISSQDSARTEHSACPTIPRMRTSITASQRTMKPASLSREVFIQRKYRDRAYILKMAEENDGDIIATRFLRAAHRGNIVELQREIALGVDLNVISAATLGKTDESQHQPPLPMHCTALMLATEMGHVLCVELLVQWNADASVKHAETQQTALDMARTANNIDIIAILSR